MAGRVVDEFLDLSLVASEWHPYLKDDFVGKLLTGDITSNGSDFSNTIAYDFLLAEMNNSRVTMSEDARMPIVPVLESGLDNAVVKGIDELRDLKNEIHKLELIGMVAGMVYYVHRGYDEFQPPGVLDIYATMINGMTKRVKQKGLDYYQKLENLKAQGIVQREGFLGFLGELFSLLPHKIKYNFGKRTNPDLLDIGFWAWRASNSWWSIRGSRKQIKPMEYYHIFKPSIYDHVNIRHLEPMSTLVGYLEQPAKGASHR